MLIARGLVDGHECHGVVVGETFRVLAGDIFGRPMQTGRTVPLVQVVLGSPVRRSRLVAVMGGFLAAGAERPATMSPRWIPKVPNCVSGQGGRIPFPASLTGPLQIEAELAVVVGRVVSKETSREANDAIFGWTVFNDVTAPEFGSTNDWSTAKSLDGFASWGPWIRTDLTEDEVMSGLAIRAFVNGALRQEGSTRRYKFRPSEIISHISHRITLHPGDVVTLGTPPPPAEVVVGDEVVLDVEGVGALRNHIVEPAL